MNPAPIEEGRFQIWLRRRQLQANYPPPDGTFQNVIVQCDPLTGAATYLPGTVDNTTAFKYPDNVHDDITIVPIDGWYDFSNWIEGQEKLDFTWDKVNNGDSQAVNKDGSNYDKGITSDLIFRDAAFRFIYLWLLATECQILNFVEVRIVDLISRGNGGAAFDPAGNYRIFEIKSDNLEYAPIDLPCVFQVKLREQDEIWHCIHKTVIWDNWQNWFGGTTVPTTKQFPCFFTCIEPRPRLISSARMGLMLFWESLIVDGIPLLAAVLYFLNKEGLIAHARRILNANKFVDAPQVYTYIQNVAGKCNMAIDTIFNPGQDWENLCLYYPSAGQMKEFDDNGDPLITDLTFIYDNRWLVTLADLLDKLKVVFCAEWYVTPNNTIVFKYIKDLIQLAPIYDYTAVGAEPIYGLKYTFNGEKKPAYGRYEYQDDGSDLASQEMDTLYNDIVDYDGSAFNPMLEGDKTKNFEFACTGFVGDGRSKNYMKLLIRDAEIVALILMAILALTAAVLFASQLASITGGQIAAGIFIGAVLIWLALIVSNRNKLEQEFVSSPKYKGAVRLTCEQVMTPRLLLWDGISMNKAMTDARLSNPVPEPYFNPTSIPYNVANQIGIDNGTSDTGAFGVYNYPLYFDSMYYGNLYGRFHDMIDNPLKSIETHQQGKFYVDLCPGQLNLYGVFQNQYAQIGKIVKVETRDGYDVYIRIGNINVDYGSYQIVITGNVIRKPAASVDDLNPGNIPVVTPEESVPTQTPTGICYKWRNYGNAEITVTYNDCNGELVTDQVIMPDERFCALEVLAADPETLAITDSCTGGEVSGSASTGSGIIPPPPAGCVPKRYVANLLENGTSDPIVTVFENTIGDIVWTRFDVGEWHGTLIGGFPGNLTWFQGNQPIPEIQGNVAFFISAGNEDFLTIYIEQDNGTPDDFLLGEALVSIEITVYCLPCEPPDVSDFNMVALPLCFGDAPVITVTSSTLISGHTYTINWTSTNPAVSGTITGRVFTFGSLTFFTDNTNTTDPVTVTVDSITDEAFPLCEAPVGVSIDITASGRIVDAGADQDILIFVTTTAALSGSQTGDGDTYLWTTSGDGSFDDDTILNPNYTAGAGDIANGIVTLTLTVSGSTSTCPAVSDSMQVLWLGNHYIIYNHTTPADGTQIDLTLGGFATTGAVDWGDGNFDNFSGTFFTLTHTYATAGTYNVFIFTIADTLTSFTNNVDSDAKINSFDSNLSVLNTIVLIGVMDINACFPVSGNNPITMNFIGHADSTMTVADYSAAPSNLSNTDIESFPLITGAINFSSSVHIFTFAFNPNLNDFDSAGAPVVHILNWPSSNGTGVTYGTLDLTACNVFIFNADFTVTEVNNFLIALDANGLSNGICDVRQTPVAAPTGAGATAKANLIGKGWTVTTD